MQYKVMFGVVLLSGCIVGCHSTRTTDHSSEHVSSSFKLSADITDMPKLITSACDRLGITIEQANEESGRYIWNCRSLSGLDVRIEAMALVKDKSFVSTSVGGEQKVAQYLNQEIYSDLYSANRNRNNPR